MVCGAEMATVCECNDRLLVVRNTGFGVNGICKAVISNSMTPVSILFLSLKFTVAGEVS